MFRVCPFLDHFRFTSYLLFDSVRLHFRLCLIGIIFHCVTAICIFLSHTTHFFVFFLCMYKLSVCHVYWTCFSQFAVCFILFFYRGHTFYFLMIHVFSFVISSVALMPLRQETRAWEPFPGPGLGEISARQTWPRLRGVRSSGRGHLHFILAFKFSFFTRNSSARLESHYRTRSREDITVFFSSLQFF